MMAGLVAYLGSDGQCEGGRVRMPIGEIFWARQFGLLIDTFGHRLDGELREIDRLMYQPSRKEK